MKPNECPPPVQLMKFIVGKWISKPIYAAAELGIADLLADGPKSIQDLALASRTHEPFLYRMMRALASIGVFSETEDKHFELTPMAECLKKQAMRSLALLFNSDWSDNAWKCFVDSIKTGRTAFETAHGIPLSDWLEDNLSAADIFHEANAKKTEQLGSAIINAYDFSGIHSLTDVGGGLGILIAEILTAHPSMKGIVADRPSVIAKAKETIRVRGIENRCQAVTCDFFTKIPSGSDAYLLSNILHDWPDEPCKVILTASKRAMKRESKLLVVEMIVPSGNEPSVAKLLDLEMMVMTGGRERTAAEYNDLIKTTGLKLSRIIPLKEDTSIIEIVQ